MTLASRHSQSLPVTGTISLSRIVPHGALILSRFEEEALRLFLAAFRPFVAILAAFKTRLHSHIYTFIRDTVYFSRKIYLHEISINLKIFLSLEN